MESQSDNTLSISKSISERFSASSPLIEINPAKRYRLSTKITGKAGLPYSAYISVIIFDSKNRERNRYIRWINDFTGNPTEYTIVFGTSSEASTATIGYRVNTETPVRCNIQLLGSAPKFLTLEQVGEEVPDSYDDLRDYKTPPLPQLSPLEEDQLEKRVIWILAAPRSGTTWLGARLLNHDDTVVWNEPWIGWHLSAMFNSEDTEADEIKSQRLIDMRADNDQYFFSNMHRENWLPALRKFILTRTFSQSQSLTKYVIIKEPTGSNASDILLSCLRRSKVIFLLRDGRDVVESRLDNEMQSWQNLPIEKVKEKRLRAIRFYSQMWNTLITTTYSAFEKHNPNLRLLIKYEALRKDTFKELKRIYTFIGIEEDDATLRKKVEYHDFNNIPESDKGSGKFNRAATTGAWRNTFDQKEQELMNSIMGPILNKMGYEI